MLNQITNLEQWRVLKFRSTKSPMLIFKHSNSSPASAAVFQQLRNIQANNSNFQPINLVIVQENREISNAIETDLGVPHRSPQIIIIKNRQSIYAEATEIIEDKKILQLLR